MAGRLTAADIRQRKNGKPLVALTSYHAHTAAIIDQHVDIILVGDSLGMVMHGFATTLPVTLEMMILQGQAVMRGSQKALVVVDMPFGSYEASPEQAFYNCAKVIKQTGAGAVKLECNAAIAPTIEFLSQRGIPVMGHVGLTPQSVNVMGGFKVQGKTEQQWQHIENDTIAVAKAGAFAIVVEGVVEELAAKLTTITDVPLIGIGASSKCDGQILVLEDMLGLSDWLPKFAKKFGDIGKHIDQAVKDYAIEVRNRQFPDENHVYKSSARPSLNE